MAKTTHALANEVSRDMGLSLSNGEFHALVNALGGEGLASEDATRRVWALGPEGVRREIRDQREPGRPA